MSPAVHGRGSGFGRSRKALGAVLAAAALAGCYTYAPVAPAAVLPGTHVRIRVDPDALPDLGASQVSGNGWVRGKVLASRSPDTFLCSVPIEGAVVGSTVRGLSETVSLPMAAVEEIEIRSLDRVRTGVVVVAGSVLAALTVNWAFDVRTGREGSHDPGNVDNAIVLTLLGIRW